MAARQSTVRGGSAPIPEARTRRLFWCCLYRQIRPQILTKMDQNGGAPHSHRPVVANLLDILARSISATSNLMGFSHSVSRRRPSACPHGHAAALSAVPASPRHSRPLDTLSYPQWVFLEPDSAVSGPFHHHRQHPRCTSPCSRGRIVSSPFQEWSRTQGERVSPVRHWPPC